jgi:hypothetical protein
MGNLEKRVAQIEGARANSDLKKMSDEELSAYTAPWIGVRLPSSKP